jgi:hydrogenase nickel incorporation protein HypA/HybF
MHELACAEGILGVALDAVQGAPVRRIRLRIGALHGIVADSLQFCFQLAAQDTPAADGQLLLTTIPVVVRCRSCGAESAGGSPPFQCRVCDALDVAVVTGEEVLIDGVEVDDGWIERPVDGAVGELARAHLREHAGPPSDR